MRHLEEIVLPAGNEEELWELFHENSKITKYTISPHHEYIAARINALEESLFYRGYPSVELPPVLPLGKARLEQVMLSRASPKDLLARSLTIKQISTLLYYSYGVRGRRKSRLRALRMVPSAGGLYPLEIFLFAARTKGLKAGIYHYNPIHNRLSLLSERIETRRIAEGLVQSKIASAAGLIIFVTAVFERSVFKYGNRGYRFVLLEAGHFAQNVNLVSCALGLDCLNIGGFFDQEIDGVIGLDGITHSTVYVLAIGKREPRAGGKEIRHGTK